MPTDLRGACALKACPAGSLELIRACCHMGWPLGPHETANPYWISGDLGLGSQISTRSSFRVIVTRDAYLG